MTNPAERNLKLVSARCCICDHENATRIGAGRNFEYDPSDDFFNAMQCDACGLVHINPRPDVADFATIYPFDYHAEESHWGGYHFPRHWNLFNRRNLVLLGEKAGFKTEKIQTQVSPVNRVYSFHNRFVDEKNLVG